MSKDTEGQHGVQSLGIGIAIAAAADMPASKVHRYMVSLVRSGLVDRLDRVGLRLSAIAQLRDEINETTALAAWSGTGPVIVRSERPHRPITVNVVTGTALNVLTSASGRVFAAWLPQATVNPLIPANSQPRTYR